MENVQQAHNEIDIVGLFLLLWKRRKRIIINCFIGGVLSIIVAFSIPKSYTSTIVLAPEFSTGANLSGGLGALASMAGFDFGGLSSGDDALYPELYPQIISSTPFLCELLALEVESKDGELKTTVCDYLKNHQRKPWWGMAISSSIKCVGKLFGVKADSLVIPTPNNMLALDKAQLKVLKAAEELVAVDVDKGNSVITLRVTTQDPKISALLVEAVSQNLQAYIGQYRSAKSRKDLAYTEKLYQESKDKYYKAQHEYAQYCDQHMGVVKKQYQIELERLANEQNLAFDVYNQIAQQLELARAKVAESTPVCVVIQPAVVPYKASSPQKMMMGLLYMFLAFFGTAAWIIIKERIIDRRMKE